VRYFLNYGSRRTWWSWASVGGIDIRTLTTAVFRLTDRSFQAGLTQRSAFFSVGERSGNYRAGARPSLDLGSPPVLPLAVLTEQARVFAMIFSPLSTYD
jgi:hypothetical protein